VSWVHRGVDKEGGGILTMWDNKEFKRNKSMEGKCFILIIGELCGGALISLNVVVLNVYAPCYNSEKFML